MTVTAMVPETVTTLLQRREVLLPGLLLSVVLLVWVTRRVRKIARSDHPDEALSNLVMLIGLGWSSEAVWEITRNRLHFTLGLTLLLFFVFEALLSLAMIRAKRHMREFGWPGRFGTTAWTVAACMSGVAGVAAHSFAEAVLRMVIPLLVTKQWWDGLVGGATKRPADASTWRWTPRRLLLALGAIEPGERDVQSVHRERLTQQMTTLYHRVNHGSDRFRQRRVARLARLSLTADDAIIAEVQRRGDRALWFQHTHHNQTAAAVSEPISVPAVPDAPSRVLPAPTVPPSSMDNDVPSLAVDQPTMPPPAAPEPEPARTDIPSPVVVATRITGADTTGPTGSAVALRAAARTPNPRPSTPEPPSAEKLAAPAPDTRVTAPEPAQLALPIVAPDLLNRADQVAQQYRTEHGNPITAGQLAIRLKVSSEQASQALAVLGLSPDNPTTPQPTVNGNRPKATP
jgi:hypothetical protein